MKKSIELVYEKGDSTIYDVEGTANKFDIKFSRLDKGWAHPNKIAVSLVDTGNDIKITIEDSIIHLDYFEVELMRLALKINSCEKVTLREIKVKKFKGLK